VEKKDSKGALGDSLKTDPLKDISLDLSTSSSSSAATQAAGPIKPEDDKFKAFDFISKQQARYLIELLKQPVFFNMLPQEAQTLVKAVNDNFSFKIAEDGKLNDFIETSLMNSPTSNTFIDPDGKVGRKGVLTLIDVVSGDSKFTWAVSNAKVLCFFQSQSFLTIVKLFRNSSIQIKDISATPCFMLSDKKDSKDGSILACATSTQEKEVWLQTITSNILK
jgi:hypothetical protein